MRTTLLEIAVDMVNQGRLPSVTELAQQAGVSHAMAYRHFPTRARLIADRTDSSLGPVRSWVSQHEEGVDWVMELFENTFPHFKEYETQLRAALLLSRSLSCWRWPARCGKINTNKASDEIC